MKLLILALIAFISVNASAADYFINSKSGNDNNTGRSKTQAWKSLERLSRHTFLPGDRILFARGSEFNGSFKAKGSGKVINGKMKPIQVRAYGEGKRPQLHGNGIVPAPVVLHNVEGWEIYDLELTNKSIERKPNIYGVLVDNHTIAVARHIILKNLFIHDVTGSFPKERGASTAIYVTRKHKAETPLRYDKVLIESNHIKDCSRNGIVVNGGALRHAWNPSINVVIRKNLIEGVGGDGILPTGCDGVLVEWNVMRDCPYLGEEGDAAAGMWPWNCDNAVFQYNEVTDHKAWVDGQAYDCDYSCKNTIFQYNLSYDNYGGFMLLCSPRKHKNGWLKDNALNDDSIVRYNLSLNDGGRDERGKKAYKSPTFNITGETTRNSQIHNNIIIRTNQKHDKEDSNLFNFGTWGGRAPVGTKIFDNIFVFNTPYKGTFEFDRTIRQTEFKNNQFYGNWSPLPKHWDVKSKNDLFDNKKVKVVEMKGNRQHLMNFKKFLEVKGNPQEKIGIKIRWKLAD